MAFVQADLDKINAAIALGRRKVVFGDRTAEYHSIDDMLKAKAIIEEELNQEDAATNGVSRPRSFRARSCKGL